MFLGIYPDETLCPPKNLHIDVYRKFIHNAKTWKQPKCPLIGDG